VNRKELIEIGKNNLTKIMNERTILMILSLNDTKYEFKEINSSELIVGDMVIYDNRICTIASINEVEQLDYKDIIMIAMDVERLKILFSNKHSKIFVSRG